MSNDVEAVDKLLKDGADINALDGQNHTPLYLAVDQNNKEMVEFLLKKGANPNIYDKKTGYTPLMILLSEPCNKEIAKILLDSGADINIQEADYGFTAPMIAAINCDASFYEMALSYNPDLKIVGKKGQDLIDIAYISEKDVIGSTIRHFKKRNEKVKERTIKNLIAKEDDDYLFLIALLGGGEQFVDQILLKKPDVSEPLIQAILNNRSELIEKFYNYAGVKILPKIKSRAKEIYEENLEDGEKIYQFLTEKDNSDWESHFYLAKTKNALKKYDEAILLFEKAHSLAKDESQKMQTLEKKLFAFMNKEFYKEAIKLSEKLIASGNKNVKILTAKAYAEKKTGKFKDAFEDVETVINSGKCGDQCENAFIIKLELLQVLKRFDEGLKFADELLKKEFDNRYKIHVKTIVVSILWNSGKLDNAIKEIDFLLTQQEISAKEKLIFLDMKIKIHAQKGECELAKKNLNNFIEEANKSGNKKLIDQIKKSLQNEKNKCQNFEL